MDAARRLLYWLLDGTKGGPNRRALLAILQKKPMNMRQLSIAAGLDYKTVQHHLELLEKNSLVEKSGFGYGAVYFVSDFALSQKEMFSKGGRDGTKK